MTQDHSPMPADKFTVLGKRFARRFPALVARAIRARQGSRTGSVMEFRGRQSVRRAVRQQLAGYRKDFPATVEAQKNHQIRMKKQKAHAQALGTSP
jgi:hypothetical protein